MPRVHFLGSAILPEEVRPARLTVTRALLAVLLSTRGAEGADDDETFDDELVPADVALRDPSSDDVFDVLDVLVAGDGAGSAASICSSMSWSESHTGRTMPRARAGMRMALWSF